MNVHPFTNTSSYKRRGRLRRRRRRRRVHTNSTSWSFTITTIDIVTPQLFVYQWLFFIGNRHHNNDRIDRSWPNGTRWQKKRQIKLNKSRLFGTQCASAKTTTDNIQSTTTPHHEYESETHTHTDTDTVRRITVMTLNVDSFRGLTRFAWPQRWKRFRCWCTALNPRCLMFCARDRIKLFPFLWFALLRLANYASQFQQLTFSPNSLART